MKDIVIVGTGGFARETAWIIERINQIERKWNLLGYIDNELSNKLSVVGNDDFLINYSKELAVVIAVGNPFVRRKIYKKYQKNANLYFPNIVDPDVSYSGTVAMGCGNIICKGTVLTVDIEMGNFNIFNLNVTVGHDCIIKNYVTVNPGTNISGNVIIDDMVDVGTGTKIIQGKKVGREVIIGAGSVVVKDVQEKCTIVGVPAKVIKCRE